MSRLELFERFASGYSYEDRKILYPIIEAIYDETMDLHFFNNLTKREALSLREEVQRSHTLYRLCQMVASSNAYLYYDFVVKIFDVALMMCGSNALYYTKEALCACLLDYSSSIKDEEEEDNGTDEQ